MCSFWGSGGVCSLFLLNMHFEIETMRFFVRLKKCIQFNFKRNVRYSVTIVMVIFITETVDQQGFDSVR